MRTSSEENGPVSWKSFTPLVCVVVIRWMSLIPDRITTEEVESYRHLNIVGLVGSIE